MNSNIIEEIERQEMIDKLIEKGYGKLIDILLSHDVKVYTKKGRLNKSAACRALGWKIKQLDDALNECREILQEEMEVY